MPLEKPKPPTTARPKGGSSSRRSVKAAASSKDSHSSIAHQYARDIVAGVIPACLEVRQACQRHLNDLASEVKSRYPYRFDEAKANYVCRFIEQMPHVKGEWARPRPGHSTLIKMEPWQVWMTCCIFGWVEKKTGIRRFTTVLALIPRKNAKSTWAGAVGDYMVAADGEFGAEVYCGATTERQAMEVFNTARRMAMRSPGYLQYFGMDYAIKSIYREEDGSRFVPVVGNPGDGSSPSCAILDELHEHTTSVLLDTMRTGMGARRQPLLICITTAGSNLAGPCFAMLGDLKKVLSGKIDNPSFFGVNYTIDATDDWKSPESLRKANPNYGVSIKPEFLQRELRSAIQSSHLQGIYKTKHLNIWNGAASGWMNMEAWDRSADPELRLEDFIGQPCYEGVDLAARIDLASRIKLYKKLVGGQVHYYAFGRHYVPKDTAMDGKHNDSYMAWIASGHLIAHDGPEIQLAAIEQEINSELPVFKHACIAFDQYSAQQMQQQLEKKVREGVILTIPQTVQHLSEPMKEIEAAVLSGRFHHNGDPVLGWAMSNVVVRVDANDNIFPRKEQPDNKIDPVSALINAMNRAYVAPAAQPSVYETRGIRTL